MQEKFQHISEKRHLAVHLNHLTIPQPELLITAYLKILRNWENPPGLIVSKERTHINMDR